MIVDKVAERRKYHVADPQRTYIEDGFGEDGVGFGAFWCFGDGEDYHGGAERVTQQV